MSMNHTHQYEPLPVPSAWGREERVFLTRLTDILDDIYLKWGRISERDLSVALRGEIRGKADRADLENYSSLEQTESAISAAVGSIRVGGRNLLLGTSHPLAASAAGEMGGYETAAPGALAGEEVTLSFDWVSDGAAALSVLAGDASLASFPLTAGSGHESRKLTLPAGLPNALRFALSAAVQVTVSRAQLEKGGVETDWGQADGELVAGSSVEITKDGVRIQTETFEVGCGGNQYMSLDAAGGYFPRLCSPQIAPRYDGPEELTVNGASPDGVTGFATLGQALSAVNGRWLEKDVTITVASACDEYDPVEISGLAGGGSLTVAGADMTVYAPVKVERCALPVTLSHLKARCPGPALTVCASAFVQAEDCAFETDSHDCGAVELREGSAGRFTGTVMASGLYALWAMDGSRAAVKDCAGDKSLCSQASFVVGSGTLPSASASSVTTVSLDNGYILAAGTVDRAGSVDPSQVAVDSADLYPGQTAYHWGAWNSGGDDLMQGYATPFGAIGGCLWFDVSSLAGRAALGGKLRLTRKAGWGQSGAVAVTLCGLSPSCAGPGGSFTRKNSYGVIGALSPGATKELALPEQAVNDLIGGVIGGLCLWAPDGAAMAGLSYSENYARFYGAGSAEDTRPRLSVTLVAT